MSSFPNLPKGPLPRPASGIPRAPLNRGQPGAAARPAGATPGPFVPGTSLGGPSAAAPPPPAPVARDVAQVPFLHTMAQPADSGMYATDQQHLQEIMRDRHTLPLAVLGIATVLTLGIFGARGFADAGPAGAIGSCMVAGILLAAASLTSTAAGWIVAKIFGEDYGSGWALLLRFSAVAAAQFPVLETVSYVTGTLIGIVFCVPIMVIIVMLVAGLGFARALVFTVLMSLINWVLIAFSVMNLAATVLK